MYTQWHNFTTYMQMHMSAHTHTHTHKDNDVDSVIRARTLKGRGDSLSDQQRVSCLGQEMSRDGDEKIRPDQSRDRAGTLALFSSQSPMNTKDTLADWGFPVWPRFYSSEGGGTWENRADKRARLKPRSPALFRASASLYSEV